MHIDDYDSLINSITDASARCEVGSFINFMLTSPEGKRIRSDGCYDGYDADYK